MIRWMFFSITKESKSHLRFYGTFHGIKLTLACHWNLYCKTLCIFQHTQKMSYRVKPNLVRFFGCVYVHTWINFLLTILFQVNIDLVSKILFPFHPLCFSIPKSIFYLQFPMFLWPSRIKSIFDSCSFYLSRQKFNNLPYV